MLLVVCTLFSGVQPTTAFAYEREINFDNTDVLEDLTSSTVNGQPFDIKNYPFDESKDAQIISFVEYCYSFRANMRENYGLYLYIYNPKGLNFSTSDKDNKVQMAVSYNDEGRPDNFEKFSLQFCSKVESGNYKNLFYKFKVIDHKVDGKYFIDRVNSIERRYDISGIELVTHGSMIPKEYSVGGSYLFTGYVKGYGPDENAESNLSVKINQLETVTLDVHSTYYRTGEYTRNHRHDLTSVYFAVPNRFFEDYGKLQRIKAEWYEYVTTPICVTSNNTVYDLLYPYLGKFTNKVSDHSLQLYTGYQEMVGSAGHYDKFDWAYNCDYTSAINESCKRISYLFSTNGADIGNYVLSDDRIQAYIESYDKSFTDGYLDIPGKTNISHDLFEKGLSADRQTVSYVGDDIHHKLVDFDADDTFDMLNYDETHDGWYKFFAGLFGLGPNDVSESLKGVSPIKIVTEEDMARDNLASTLLINGSEEALQEFRDFYNESKEQDKTVVLFRFAQTDYVNLPVIAYDSYRGKNLSGQYGKDTFIIQESVFMNFDIIQLTFNKEGVYTVIPVVSDPIDIYNDITIPDVTGLAWWQILLLLILVVFLLILLWPVLPYIIRFIWWLILLPFKLIGLIVKAIKKGKEKRKIREAKKLEKELEKIEKLEKKRPKEIKK
jgi:hypothetical protein